MKQFNVLIQIPGKPTQEHVEVTADSLEQALKVAWESDWEVIRLKEDINIARKERAYPAEVWTEPPEGEFMEEWTEEEIDGAWEKVKKEIPWGLRGSREGK